MKNSGKDWLSWVTLVVLAIIWGSSFILMKLGMFDAEGQSVFTWDQVAAMRIAFAGLTLVVFVGKILKTFTSTDWGWVIAVGIVGNTIPAFLFTAAETQVDSGFAGVLNAMTPLFVLLIGVLFFSLKVKRLQILGIAIGFAGAAGLILKNNLPSDINYGYSALILVATMFYGVSVNIIHGKLGHLKSVHIAAAALSVVAVPCSIYLFSTDFVERVQTIDGALNSVMFTAILGVVGTALALVMFNKLIQRTSGVFATTVTYLIPIVALIWGVIFGEKVTLFHALFGLLILSGVYMINAARKR